jgi:hypothetical protein
VNTTAFDLGDAPEFELDFRDFDAIDADEDADVITAREILSGLPAHPGTLRC